MYSMDCDGKVGMAGGQVPTVQKGRTLGRSFGWKPMLEVIQEFFWTEEKVEDLFSSFIIHIERALQYTPIAFSCCDLK